MLKLLFKALIFVALGILIISIDKNPREQLIINTVGWVSVICFGFGILIIAKKIIDRDPGLIINSTGVTDNSSILPCGFIPWSDITGFTVFNSYDQKMIVVMLRNPSNYIECRSIIWRKLIRYCSSISGSPVLIAGGLLEADFSELYKTCKLYKEKYGNPA